MSIAPLTQDEGAGPPLLGFAIALLIGALVGVEREQKKRAGEQGTRGLRTFVLISESGAIAAWLSSTLETPWIFVGVGTLVAAAVLAGYLKHTDPGSLGMTTEFAALVVYLLGGLVLFGHTGLAVGLAIATSALLAFREPMHELVDRIGRDDLQAGLKLLIATFIVLPVLPNRPVDPWGALNPYEIWWLVILISALSLLGYAATRALGRERGLVVTGLAGGLVSSTAVTLAFARQSREPRAGAPDSIAAGLVLAWTVMFARVGVMVAVVHRPLLASLALPMTAMGATALAVAAWFYVRARRAKAASRAPHVLLKNPFRLTASIRFGLLFALVLLAVELMRRQFPAAGLYAVGALAGLVDVDAITLSMAELARGGAALSVATGSIVIAAVANTLAKCAIVSVLGARALRLRVFVATAFVLVSGASALLLGSLAR
jgi:uncharacterized membrane protein (DUF4010 family)